MQVCVRGIRHVSDLCLIRLVGPPQTGVAGMSAFFKRQIENSTDSTLTNEQKVISWHDLT